MDSTEKRLAPAVLGPAKVPSGPLDAGSEEPSVSVPRGPVGLKPAASGSGWTTSVLGLTQASGAQGSYDCLASAPVPGDDMNVLISLNSSHAHVQWRMIAESFSELLTPDFVDIVLKVRNGADKMSYLAAHRALLAAAWPSMRDELRHVEAPGREIKVAGLSWSEASQEQDAVRNLTQGSPQFGACQPGQGHPQASAPVPPLQAESTASSAATTRASPSPTAAATSEAASPTGMATSGANGDGADSPLSASLAADATASASSAAKALPRKSSDADREANLVGVLDLTAKTWGFKHCVQALLCHLYGRPVVIPEPDLNALRKAAQWLGCAELVKCCEEKDRRYFRRAPVTRSMDEARENHISPSNSVASLGGGGSTTGAGTAAPASATSVDDSSPGVSRVPSAVAPVTRLETKGADWYSRMSREDLIPVPTSGPEVSEKPAVEKVEKVQQRGDVVRVSSRPEGKRSFIVEKEGTRGALATSDAHQVLTEIKRNIVESSRIIADKTFQQMYEMVAGERGILGEGINGPVRMAKHRKTGREVAVKRISCVNLSEQRRQMLVSEIRIFLQVSHRNIVQLLEVYESEVDQAVLLVMELCTGGELFQRLADRHWYSEFDASRVTRHMLDAVSYLHSQNICHRDLKLENWLYENPSMDAKLKLCDFGFGQIVEPSVKLTATLGSLFYVAPEVLDGSYGLPCDVWSVGVIVYMLLSGIPPFDGKTDTDVMQKIKQGRFVSTGKRWETVSETAKHFIRCMLRKDPYERLTAAEAAQHAWLKMESHSKNYSWPKGGPDSELDLPINRKVIEDMWKFAQNNAIARAALGMLNKLCTSTFGGREEDVLALEHRFRSYDEQNTGKIDAEIFITVLKETLQISTAEEKQFFERIAGDGDRERGQGQGQKKHRRREVNYSDFITLTKARRMANNTAAIREAFRGFDEIGDGYINQEDMHRLLGDEFKTTIDNYVDVNGKECIDYVHFANTISQEMAKKDLNEETYLGKQPVATNDSSTATGDRQARSQSVTSIDMKDDTATKEAGEKTPHSLSAERLQAAANASNADKAASGSGIGQDGVEGGDGAADGEGCRGEGGENRNAADDEEEDEEEAEPDADVDAQSDEEQLVNVQQDWPDKKEGDVDATTEAHSKPDTDSKKPEPKSQEKVSARFQSFSLSLAGSSEYDDVQGGGGINRVLSMPSDVYSIRQLPGFHTRILRPFYAARPVSNVVMGLIRGTSLYAKQSVSAKLATIIHTTCGWFFLMPNPKYHGEVDTRKGLLSKESGKFRFVAWWIHPRFVPQTRQWFERLTYEGIDKTRQEQRREARAQHESKRDGQNRQPGSGATAAAASAGEVAGEKGQGVGGEGNEAGDRGRVATFSGHGGDAATGGHAKHREDPVQLPDIAPGVGNPGDFQFSDVPKPENYLHTYRDLHTREHVNMLTQLQEGTQRFLRSLFDESFVANATISAGFHYPVRTQYATLHMQLRVNSGSVCRDDGRGIEIQNLIENMKRNRHTYEKDDETSRYSVTENVKVSLLAAANEYEEQNSGECASTQTAPLAFDLGLRVMPTIHDQDNEEEEDDDCDNNKDSDTGKGFNEMKGDQHGGHAGRRDASGRDNEGLDVFSPSDRDRSGLSASAPSAPLQAPLATGGDNGHRLSYLVNLQPSVTCEFGKLMYERRERCAELYGRDPTYLYPLHVSVTGFFDAYPQEVESMIPMMAELLKTELAEPNPVHVGEVICTSTGYVLFDMRAPGVSSFSRLLAERTSKELGLYVRAKAVNHISLASHRSEAEARERIKHLYAVQGTDPKEVQDAYKNAQFDLVLSRLLARTSFENFDRDGPHSFMEVARMPIGQANA